MSYYGRRARVYLQYSDIRIFTIVLDPKVQDMSHQAELC